MAQTTQVNTLGQLIVQKVASPDPQDFCAENPAVLSCGGIYLPRPSRRTSPSRFRDHILTTSNEAEPVKVFSWVNQVLPNLLQQVLAKEALN